MASESRAARAAPCSPKTLIQKIIGLRRVLSILAQSLF